MWTIESHLLQIILPAVNFLLLESGPARPASRSAKHRCLRTEHVAGRFLQNIATPRALPES